MKRAVPYTSLWLGVTCWVIVLSLSLGFGGWFTYKNYLFTDHGRQIQGKVIQKYITVSQGKHGPSYTHHIVYGYRVGNLVVNIVTVAHGNTYSEYAEGGAIPIKYLPENPKDSRIDNESENRMVMLETRFLSGAGLIVLALGSVVLFLTIRKNKLNRRLVTAGLSCLGRITSVETERAGKQMVTYLKFEFTSNQGDVVQGRTWALSQKQQWFWDTDKAIKVFFDPTQPEVFTVDLDPTHYDGPHRLISNAKRGAPWLGSAP